MKLSFVKISLFFAALSMFFIACEKYKDKKGDDIQDQLKNKYCNIPFAINYNWGFPGIEDNSTCYFAYEFFEGSWIFIDTVSKDEVVLSIDTIPISFARKEADTTLASIEMMGLCNLEKLNLITDKFYNAITDTMENGEKFQVICNNQDTIAGTIARHISDSTNLSIKLSVTNANGTFIHKGIAIR